MVPFDSDEHTDEKVLLKEDAVSIMESTHFL